MNKQSRQLFNFLKKENQMLKDDIKELKEILRLNKEALKVSLAYKNEQDFQKCIPQLIKLLYEENGKLHGRIDELRSDIEAGMCKALISEQIAFESTEQEINLANELKDRLHKMRRQLQNKEKKIIELTKLSLDQRTGVINSIGGNNHQMNTNLESMLKLVEYSDMNKVTKKLKDSMERINQQLDSKKEEIERLKDGKDQLMKLNLILTRQLNQMKLLTSCQTTKSNNEMSIEISNNDLTKYLKYQKKLVNQEENIYEDNDSHSEEQSGSEVSDSNSSEIDQFPSQEEYNQNENNNHESDPENETKQESKANQSMQSMNIGNKPFGLNQKAKMNMTLNLGVLGLKKSETMSKNEQKPKFNIPKLQLTKAKQIQNLIVKKINNDQKKKKQGTNQPYKEEKYKKLQDQLENLRKKLGNQILQKLSFERECNFLKKIVCQLEERNNMLVERRILQEEEQTYEKRRNNDMNDNLETLLDICRDVTLNNRLRRVVLGQQSLPKKYDIETMSI